MPYTVTTETRVDGLYYIFNFGAPGTVAIRAASHASGRSMLEAATAQLESSGGIGDGDKGDITVSGGVWRVKSELLGGSGSSSWASVTGKPTTFPPETHTHVIADTTGLQSALDGKQAAGSYAAATHTHAIADTNGLQSALDGKAASSHTHTASQVTDFSTAADARIAAASVNALADVTVTSPSTGQVLKWSGSAWVNDTDATGSGAANFDGYTQMVPAATLFVANSANATALGTQAQVADRAIIAPFVAAYTMTIDQLGVSVSTLLAGANAKCVIFDSDSNGRPTTILRETGNISAAATGTVFAAITSLALTAGKTYWIGVRASGTFTLRTLAVGALPALDYTNAATPVARQCLIRTETFANAAGNWTYASSQHSNALMPLVLMRVA